MSRNRQKQSDLLAIERRQGQRLEQIAAQRRAVTVASIKQLAIDPPIRRTRSCRRKRSSD